MASPVITARPHHDRWLEGRRTGLMHLAASCVEMGSAGDCGAGCELGSTSRWLAGSGVRSGSRIHGTPLRRTATSVVWDRFGQIGRSSCRIVLAGITLAPLVRWGRSCYFSNGARPRCASLGKGRNARAALYAEGQVYPGLRQSADLCSATIKMDASDNQDGWRGARPGVGRNPTVGWTPRHRGPV